MRKLLFLVAMLTALMAQPSWIDDPTQNHTIMGVVGICAKNYPDEIKYRAALMQAKAELSHATNLTIKTQTQTSHKGMESHTSTKTQIASQNTFKVYVKDRYTDTHGVLYLWVVKE